MNPRRTLLTTSLALIVITAPAISTPAANCAQAPAPQIAPQPHSQAPARFEVASVRMSPPNAGYTSIQSSGSPRFTAHNATLKFLVALAFGISSGDIDGGPKWLDTQTYDVDAKAEGDAPLTPKQFRPFLQQLLMDRFHLAAHRKTVYRSGYALVVARNGPRLTPGKTSSKEAYVVNDGFRLEGASMEAITGVLAMVVQSPVADKTGLKGEFDVNLKYAPTDGADSALPSVFTALEEDLGLKLVRDNKVPVENLVIDSVEKIPTEN